MGQNPFNLLLRFVLELAALASLGYWGWTQFDGALRFLLAIGLPLLAATIWGTFRVPGDASASGRAPVPVRGTLRLLIELGLFGSATWALFDAGATGSAYIFGGLVFLHYIVSYDRIAWLMKQ
jgi:hypothetical protein